MVNGQVGVTVHGHVEMPIRFVLRSVWIHRGNNAQNRHVKVKDLKRDQSTDRATTQRPVKVNHFMFKNDFIV